MYPEFIAIYVGLGIHLLVGIANLVLTIKLMMNGSQPHYSSSYNNSATNDDTKNKIIPENNIQSDNVVFCKKCANEFDALQKFCPKCGTPRQ